MRKLQVVTVRLMFCRPLSREEVCTVVNTFKHPLLREKQFPNEDWIAFEEETGP